VNDPTLPGRTAESATGETSTNELPPPADRPGGGGGNRTGTLSQCQNITSDSKQWEAFTKDVESKKSGIGSKNLDTLSILGSPIFPSRVSSTFPSFANKYINLRNIAQSNSFYGSEIKTSTIGFECTDFQRVIDSFNGSTNKDLNLSNSQLSRQNEVHNQKIIVCSRNIKSIIDKAESNLKCSDVGEFIGPPVPDRLR
jgi:hypothetical protein